jgi:hypothetical protein
MSLEIGDNFNKLLMDLAGGKFERYVDLAGGCDE